MTRRVLPALIVLVAYTIAVAQVHTSAVQNQTTTGTLNPFPGGVGSYWIYNGVVRQAPGVDYANAEKKKLRWRMSVDRVLRRDGTAAVIVEGFPDDVDWSDNPQPKQSMFVLTGDGGLYRMNGDQKLSEQKFNDPHVTTAEFLEDAEPWFQWPPVLGAQPGGGTCPDRRDDMYCWILLEAPENVTVRGVKGIPAGSRTSYTLAYRTNPDDTEVDIVSGVGVTDYQYHHHGTIAEVELHLVEAHLTEEK